MPIVILTLLFFPLWQGIPRSFDDASAQKLEKAMATHSSTLAWQIPRTEEPGRLQSMGSLGVRHDWVTSLSLSTFMHWRRKWQPTPVFLPGESQGWASLVGCPAVSGVAQSQTWLKRFSSSSSSSSEISLFWKSYFHLLENVIPKCREGDGTPLQYSCQENPTDGGAWWAAVHGVARSQTRLSDFTLTFHFHALE